jgi:hypothetical protein
LIPRTIGMGTENFLLFGQSFVLVVVIGVEFCNN